MGGTGLLAICSVKRVLELGRKAGRKELEAQWKALRRGWYVGEASFLEKLEAYLEAARAGRQRESHSGRAKDAHDEAAAEPRGAESSRRMRAA